MTQHVEVAREGDVLEVKLNKLKVNAIDHVMSRELSDAFRPLRCVWVGATCCDRAEWPWRDSRLERIRDGTSEIQRHIITRSILRPLGA